ncbi:oligopeptide ABC transporter ATP-binding protein [Haloferax elongans ATCC BAA-1513]|uniref:Nickel import system ATP-binding protein NikD n=1 Tax=Haloferax elongans ATCC BAA-1513 TaxID=1230453 RepID=M0HLH9_HALEO|nr:ABC transporter ATP-binding protein [Haloferax elongans]ELZ84648.1 oligopeptide ABC transporter ATP-binding protein [Haloferax elongans ATCC BAA-1513]
MSDAQTTLSDADIDAETEAAQVCSDDSLLSVRNLQTRFQTAGETVQAVDGVSFDIAEGEILGIVGESGCGKSVTSLSLMDIVPEPGEVHGGTVRFDGEDILTKSPEEKRQLRGNRVSMVFQEPAKALNPVFDIGWQVGEPLRVHENLTKSASRAKAVELMRRVGIPSPEERVDDYPHEFSGGMRQRAMLAMALACTPDLLIADEPTTALDVTIEAQILDLIQELNVQTSMSVLIVTHDLGVVAEVCDRVAVMYAGRVVEYGDVEDIFANPQHPYTKGLIDCVPDPTADEQSLEAISGTVPNLADTPEGCNFAPRCPHATDECRQIDPRMRAVGDDHYSACLWEDPS